MSLIKHINYIKSDIGRNLLIIRKASKFSHMDLVSITGLTRPILSTIENTTANPTLETIIKLCYALNISHEMLIMSKIRFNQLNEILKSVFEREKQELSDLLIPTKIWKMLLDCSGNESKKNCSIVAGLCSEVIRQNYMENDITRTNNMILGASLGVIFQEDGFKHGLEFGIWLGSKFKTNLD